MISFVRVFRFTKTQLYVLVAIENKKTDPYLVFFVENFAAL